MANHKVMREAQNAAWPDFTCLEFTGRNTAPAIALAVVRPSSLQIQFRKCLQPLSDMRRQLLKI
jgi:mannose-1-phosphate guanylyltransferase